MTTETRQRIRAYKKALPELRERVIAVALLLAMSVSMLASASFAWLTISRNPEVSGVSTTVAANGNLEIALATGTSLNAQTPEESKVGDSSASQDVTKANITWGNLINLSDSSYGLDNLTLRPAQLNRSSLLINPLYGATYQSDGRVEKLNSAFGFATWTQDEKGNEYFGISNNIGVRAISSVKVEAVGWAKQVYEFRSSVETANFTAGNAYLAITNNSGYMNTLAVVMGTFMTAKMNADQGDESLTNPTMDQKDIQNLRDLFRDFIAAYDLQFQAMAELANYQLFLNTKGTGYTPLTAADIKAKNTSGTQVSGVSTAVSDYEKLQDGYVKLIALAEQGTVNWADSGLDDIVNNLMNVSTCTLDGTPIGNIGVSNATGYLDGNTHTAIITNGVLYNFEHLNGTTCKVEGLTVSAKVKRMGMTIPASISANITTTQYYATDPALFWSDLADADTLDTGGELTEVAQDTYGLALDIWVRTNADSSYLILEGNVLTKTDYVEAVGTDINGNTVDIYTLTRKETDGEGNETSYTFDLYKIETTETNETSGEEETTTTWYNAETHATITLEDGETPSRKINEVVTVIGYEGENRVWEDAKSWEDGAQLSLDSTTQGAGSCYVYYADTPEDQARSLELLDSMNVAFVDDSGVLLATASMDTDRYYAENGRVTVPLVLDNDSIEVGTDTLTGETIYGITALEKNVPKRITAIVYLDGTKLHNEDVLAASDIQGKLNIQFGSSVTLSHAEDEALLVATRSVSATVSETNFKYDESKASGTPMTTTVTLNVDGDTPKTVTGFFIRAISSTQGSREEPMTFTNPSGDGVTWVADYTFTAPGNYVLRSVELDGQTYDLDTPPSVTVEGFTVKSLSMGASNHTSIMTAASSYSVGLTLEFASSDESAMPVTVQGRFLRTDGTAVNVNFTYNATAGIWSGTANFIASGEYTLQYLVLDGEYTQLDEGLWKTASVKLGMKSAVYTTSPSSFKYVPSELADNEKNLYMQVKIMDNGGNVLQGLQGAHLYYSKQGSTTAGLDAPLTWDGATGYYTCTFPSSVGVYYFSHITVGSNTITYAETSPTFRIISPEPPAYTGYVSLPYKYNPNGDTVMQVNMTYSSGTSVMAVIRNLDDNKTYEVEGTMSKDENNAQTWDFLIPRTQDGKQDGNWQLETIKVWNFYDADGNFIYAATDEVSGKLLPESDDNKRDDPLEFAVDGHVTKAVTTVYVSVNAIADAELGKDDTNGVTGKFMDSYSISGLTVIMEDFEDKPVEGGTVTLGYAYGNNSVTYGGYSSASLTNALVDIDGIAFTSSDNREFVQDGSFTVKYAGTYTPVLTCKIGDTTCTVSDGELSKLAFSIHSVAPSVTITGVTPTGTYSVDTNTTGRLEDTAHEEKRSSNPKYRCYWKIDDEHIAKSSNTSYIPSKTVTTANVYFKCTHNDTSPYGYTNYYYTQIGCWGAIWDNVKYHEYTQPTVTITLANKGNAASATLAFADSSGTAAHIYASNGGTTKADYTWTANGAKTMYIGLYGDSDGDDDTKTVAGTVTATVLTLTDSAGVVYTVDIADLTINNPY